MTLAEAAETLKAATETELHVYAETLKYELFSNAEGWWWKHGINISRFVYHTKREALLHIFMCSVKQHEP